MCHSSIEGQFRTRICC